MAPDQTDFLSSCRDLTAKMQHQGRRLLETGGPSATNDDWDWHRELGAYPESISRRLRAEFCGSGPLEGLLADDQITEIIVNGEDSIWYEREGRLHQCPDRFTSTLTLNNFIHRLAGEIGVVTDLNVPCGDGHWRGFRAHLIQPPLADQIQLCLRRNGGSLWTLAKLADSGWASPQALAKLAEWLTERKNFLIVGGTGSGKTSVLNACLKSLPADERVIAVEDTDELTRPNPASCKLLTRADSNGFLRTYDLGDLIRQSLRMRPSRLVVGEVRGPEAKDLLLALATGHTGSLGTLHASDARQALLRLEMLVQLGAGQWDTTAIRQLIQLSIDGIAVVARRGESRALEGLYEIAALESFGFLLERVA